MKKLAFKRSTLVMLASLLLCLGWTNVHAQSSHCATMERLEIHQQQDPALAGRMEEMELAIQRWISDHPNSGSRDEDTIFIPIVFHVVYNTPDENIAPEKVTSQVRILNENFNGENANFGSVPSVWNAVKADCGIRFCLAELDPDGNPTTGITYTFTTRTSFTAATDSVKFDGPGHAAWPTDRYLNIWVCNLELPYIAYAQLPATGPAETEGVVLSYMATGDIGALYPNFALGKSAVHEVGHYLGLRHIWGDDNGACTGTDFVADTPNQAEPTYNCPNFPYTDACTLESPGIMYMNYMDYSGDYCLAMFTQGQSARMHAILNLYRSNLAMSSCELVGRGKEQENGFTIYPNPNKGPFKITLNTVGEVDIKLFDPQGRLVLNKKVQATGKDSMELNLQIQGRGIYLLQVTAEEKVKTQRIVVQ